jgi:hypothetical protein
LVIKDTNSLGEREGSEIKRISWIVEMMVIALGETCWNNERGYH